MAAHPGTLPGLPFRRAEGATVGLQQHGECGQAVGQQEGWQPQAAFWKQRGRQGGRAPQQAERAGAPAGEMRGGQQRGVQGAQQTRQRVCGLPVRHGVKDCQQRRGLGQQRISGQGGGVGGRERPFGKRQYQQPLRDGGAAPGTQRLPHRPGGEYACRQPEHGRGGRHPDP